MQALVAAKKEAELFNGEIVCQKRALKDLQKDMQAMQKRHDGQMARIKASKFPVAQVMFLKLAPPWPLLGCLCPPYSFALVPCCATSGNLVRLLSRFA